MKRSRRSTDSLNPSPEMPPKTQTTLDRFTSLPDSIILHIFSFLNMQQVIKTSLLSKQCQFLWTSTSTFIFSHRNEPEELIRKFISFVDKTLALLTSPKLDKFSVDFAFHRRFSADVNVWLRIITSRNVEDLHLNLSNENNFGDGEFFILPQYFYDNGFFVNLNLVMCSIVPKGVVAWKSLKSFRVGSTSLSLDVIRNIVLGCPALEYLELYNCWGFDKLEIDSENVKKLVINGYFDQSKKYSDVVIRAPNVRSLVILGCWYRKIVRLENLSSVVEIELDFWLERLCAQDPRASQKEQIMLSDLLVSCQHAKDLTFGTWCIEVGLLTPFIYK